MNNNYKKKWLEKGIYITKDVKISPLASIGVGCVISGKTVIQNEAQILPYCIISDSIIGKGAIVGPFSHLRPETVVCDNAKVGAFVEIKKSTIGLGSKVPHLSYVGDASIGENTNIGCGVVFCNYDGTNKHKTSVGNNCFIGSNCNLIAPLKIGDNCFTAAGSTIAKELPSGTFAIERTAQINKQNKKLCKENIPQ